MPVNDFIFDLEDLEYRLYIISCTAAAVSEQLTSDLNDENAAILQGIIINLSTIEKDLEELKDRGFQLMRET